MAIASNLAKETRSTSTAGAHRAHSDRRNRKNKYSNNMFPTTENNIGPT